MRTIFDLQIDLEDLSISCTPLNYKYKSFSAGYFFQMTLLSLVEKGSGNILDTDDAIGWQN